MKQESDSPTPADSDAEPADWAQWIIGNAASGADRTDVERALIEAVGREAMKTHLPLLDVVFATALAPHLNTLIRRNNQMASVLDLIEELAPPSIERRSDVSRDAFAEQHWSTSRPVILTDVCNDWPALKRWGIKDLRSRFGDVDVFVSHGEDRRNGDFKREDDKMSISTFCDLLDARATAPANDIYMVSRNQAMHQDGLQPLLDDVRVDDRYLDPERVAGHTALWVGPAGTFTPLHHDQTSVLFCQVVGRKTVRMLPPFAQDLLPHVDGFYADTIPDEVWAKAREVTLTPGDALFIPVGWWHEIRAETFSMSLTFMNFRAGDNKYRWYRL